MIKGYLKRQGITSQHVDLSVMFLKKCLNLNYIKENLFDYYNKLNPLKKEQINFLSKNMDILRKNVSSEARLLASENFIKGLNCVLEYYDLSWNKKGIFFKKPIIDIDEIINLSFSSDCSVFDSVLNDELDKFKNDFIYICVSYDFQLPFALRFAKMIKENNTNSKIILGGNYLTHIIDNCEELMKKFKFIDVIVFYGYLNTIYELIEHYDINFNNVVNTFIRKNNKVLKNNIKKDNINDISLYIPDFSDLDFNLYLTSKKTIPLLLNYGCYYGKCNFCSHHFYYGGYCAMDFDKICKFIKNEYFDNKIECIIFVDECLPANVIIDFALFLIDNNIKINWLMETRIDTLFLNIDTVKTLYQSGCKFVTFGIESNSNVTLRKMNKNVDLKVAKKVLKNFYLNGIITAATFMVGYPTEKWLSVFKTFNFIKHFKYIDVFGLNIFKLVRNSILASQSNVNKTDDLGLIYSYKGEKRNKMSKKILRIYKNRKFKNHFEVENKILNRVEYTILDRSKFSLNFK